VEALGRELLSQQDLRKIANLEPAGFCWSISSFHDPRPWKRSQLEERCHWSIHLAGLAFDLEGANSHQLAIPPAAAFPSAQGAAETVEVYWQAVLPEWPFRNIPLTPARKQRPPSCRDSLPLQGPG
jgi:hypothetical protein